MAEKVARLNDEQWDILKAALEGEIADLKAQLQQAQEERDRWKEKVEECRVGSRLMAQAIQDYKAERDVAIKQAEAAEALAKRLVARLNTVNSTAEQAKQLVGLIQDEVQDCLRGSAPAEALAQRGAP